jgi:SAM-dependent methyltransferase
MSTPQKDRREPSSVDWRAYSAESDRKYKEVLDGRNFDDLVDHNIIDGSDQELQFILDCAAMLLTPPSIGTALDVCCGAGTMTETLRRAGFVATGLELNADAVRLAEQKFPGCAFIVGDAAAIGGLFPSESFDLVLIREGHPFSRIDDFDLQRKLIEDYLRLLRPGGLLVIAHARRGGGMHYPSLDFARVRRVFGAAGIPSAGPIFFFLMKHLRYRPRSRALTQAFSLATRLLQSLMRDRWIEFLFLSKPKSAAARKLE